MNFSQVSNDANDRFILVKRRTNEVFLASPKDALFFDTVKTAARFIADGSAGFKLVGYRTVEVGTDAAREAFTVTFGRVKKSRQGYNRSRLEKGLKPLGLVLYPAP